MMGFLFVKKKEYPDKYYKLKKNCEFITNYNFITRYLHSNKYKHLIKCLNKLNKEKIRILDIGCGTCNLYKNLNTLFKIEYIGVENEKIIYNLASDRYNKNSNFKIYNIDVNQIFLEENFSKSFDIIICFDVLEHMSLNKANILLNNIKKKFLFEWLYINIPNEIGLALFIKNIGSALMGYSRHKEYSFKETMYASLYKLNKLKHNNNHKGFDWRNIHTICKKNFDTYDITYFPPKIFNIILSPSIFISCK